MTREIILLSLFLFLSGSAVTQANPSPTFDLSESSSTSPTKKEHGFFDNFSGNPGKAALYSLILPGAGQFYNKRYWKVPLALAAEGAAIYILSYNIKQYNKWDKEWKFQVTNGFNNPEITSINNADTIKRLRDQSRQRKDYSWVGLIGVHLIITFEAFIDRHLIEFDVSEDLSMSLRPSSQSAGLSIVFNFN